MNKAIAIVTVTMMALSTSVSAATLTKQSERTLRTETFSSEQKAQQAGFKTVHQLRELPSEKLAFQLGIVEPQVIPNSVKINDSEVIVESVYAEPNKASYRAIVDIDYQYQIREQHQQ